MYRKVISYKNFDNEEVTKPFYFNLTQTEFLKMNRLVPGGLEGFINRVIETKDADGMVFIIDLIINHSYGEKLEDGSFTKTGVNGRPLSDVFKCTEAYDTLFLSLVKDENAFKDFVLAIVPKDVAMQAEKNWDEIQVKKEEGILRLEDLKNESTTEPTA